MDVYDKLADLRCFTRHDMVELTGSEESASLIIDSYLEKGYIRRIRRDLYAAVNMETKQLIPDRFHIASHSTSDSYVSHHSAFEFYGCADREFSEIYFSTKTHAHAFDFDGLHYKPVIRPDRLYGREGVVEINPRLWVTSLEQTVIDSIAAFSKIGGLEELLRCLALVPAVDEKKLLEALKLYDRGRLYQKTGYILEFYQHELMLSDDFFHACETGCTHSKTYFHKKGEAFVYHKKWRLYAPKDLRRPVEKGETANGGG